MTGDQPSLARRLTFGGAVAIGLASMIGAGVFSVFAPAAAAAGDLLLVGLAIAAFVAFANAGSTAQLAARYPESGGAYRYGRERLGEWPGFLAGWGFVIGKTASCAAMAMTAAAYLVPEAWQRPVAIAAVLVIVAVNLRGITRTSRAATVIVTIVLAVLVLVIVAGIVVAVIRSTTGLTFAFVGDPGAGLRTALLADAPTAEASAWGVLQAAGLIFFAFAGYARVATLGEEVVDPARTIPRAIQTSLGIVFAVYAAIAVVLLAALGSSALAASTAPLADTVALAGWGWAEPIVRAGAGLAALGALLALIAGIGRTGLAMARDRELPAPLAAVHPRFRVPHVAEATVGAAIVVLILVADLRGAIGFSSFGVLVYYLVANLAAVTQPRSERRVPRALSVAGAIGCLVLVVTLPWLSVVAGAAVFAVGAAVRLVVRARRRRLAA
ncbi:APC family permease [Agromyces aerolatus]|uniref:APC family permease n=1 Tax=Agromyces sp. LY-1074 TaxID=3074080 RepID=UPI0028554EA3|nr:MULTISPECIES: APC family permease [unclassified Agromyces]MDR5698268.1 APC family permease [Agromyces sp. LY-1074]MDR5704562.1 APC family permease [Agromyces sp. LY-1358]